MIINLSNPAHLLVLFAIFALFSVIAFVWGDISEGNEHWEAWVAIPTLLSWVVSAAMIGVPLVKLVASNW